MTGEEERSINEASLMALSIAFSKALWHLSSPLSLALESWEVLEDLPFLEGPGWSEALSCGRLAWHPVDVEAMTSRASFCHKCNGK